ncbi:MAG: hypothetical protein IKX65_11490 [Prevotella sp.]|nr:hypothetical protein [Prevotella sp.]
MKKFIILLVIAIIPFGVSAKGSHNRPVDRNCYNSQRIVQSNDKNATLVTSGTGNTKEKATRNALRNAIEQAFGTFVSSNTEVLNDNLIKDEIVTVTTGNIKNYKELYCTQNGSFFCVSLQVTVSIGNLISYAQNKGMKAELAGATFAMNMKMRKLNKENELKAMDNLKSQLCIIANSGLFDFQIEIGEPHMATEKGHVGSNGKWTQDNTRKVAVDVTIKQLINSKTIEFRNTFLRVLNALCLTKQEIEDYKSAGIPYYDYGYEGSDIVLRNKYDLKTIMDIVSFARCFFSIKDNLGHIIIPYMRVYEGVFYKYEFRGDYSEGGMRSNNSSIYYPSGKRIIITQKTMPSFEDPRSYILEDILYAPNYKTGYRNDNYNHFIEIGLSSSMLFSQSSNYGSPWSKYGLFMKQGSSFGELFDKSMEGIKITLFYTDTEIEKLGSIQVDPILSNFNLDGFCRLY